jgi:hypothetical protein
MTGKIKNSEGRNIMPPPIPNNPERIPEQKPINK